VAERRLPADLDDALADLGRAIEYPPTPDLASRLHARVATAASSHPRARAPLGRWRRSWRRLHRLPHVAAQHLAQRPPRLPAPISTRPAVRVPASLRPSPPLAHPSPLLLAGLLVLSLGLIITIGLAASPAARAVLADRLGVRGVLIEQVPAASPTLSPAVGAALDLGEPATLEAAQRQLPLLVPALPALGAPSAVYVAPGPAGGRVALVYDVRAGLPPPTSTGVSLLLLEVRAPSSGFDPIVVRKTAGPATGIEDVTVNGGHGVWLEGAPHQLFLPDPSGQFHLDQVRLAANVLLWEQGGLLLRLEGSLSRDKALTIAASVQ